MLIGVDGNEANVEKRVGIGEFSFELISEFSKNRSKDLSFIIYLKDQPGQDFPTKSENFQYKIVKPRKFWTQFALPLSLFWESPKPDVFFSPSHYAPRFSRISRVMSVMDLSYIHFSEMFNKDDLYQLRNWTKYSVEKAKKVITISEFSKNAIIEGYKLPVSRVIVVYPGIKNKPSNKRMEDIKKKYNINRDYILFVGTIQPRKNIAKLVEAFSKLKFDGDLLVVGKRGWQYEEILETPSKFGVTDRVKFLEFVDDSELPLLYKNARCFVLPSLYEGFGLPVLEAMKNDCPVVISNVSSLPEAGGDAALYVDPNNAADIAEKVQKILDDPKLSEELVKKGHEQVKKFSWEKTAKEVLEVLKEVASER